MDSDKLWVKVHVGLWVSFSTTKSDFTTTPYPPTYPPGKVYKVHLGLSVGNKSWLSMLGELTKGPSANLKPKNITGTQHDQLPFKPQHKSSNRKQLRTIIR